MTPVGPCARPAPRDVVGPVATHRTKKTLKKRPKYKQERSLKNRKIKARKAAARKRSVNNIKTRRKRRGKLKKR